MKNLQRSPKTTQKKLQRLGRKTKAVSPVVATLILIIVAIIGAISVGLIVSNIGTSTAGSANQNLSKAGSGIATTTLTLGGSTTLYPLDETAIPVFESIYHITITDSQGGSNAGMQGVISGALNIGAASSSSAVATAATYVTANNILGVTITPTLIGGSGVVVIENGAAQGAFIADKTPTQCQGVTRQALQAIYEIGSFGITATGCGTGTPTWSTLQLAAICTSPAATTLPATFGGATNPLAGTVIPACVVATDNYAPFTAVSRSDSGGTEDTFTGYIGLPNQAANPAGLAGSQQSGNAGILNYVNSHPNTIGFVDIGFAEGKATGGNCTTYGVGNLCGVAIAETISSSTISAIPTVGTATANGYVAYPGSPSATEGFIKSALKSLSLINPLTNTGATISYPDTGNSNGLARTFYFVTNGAPTATEQQWISFMTSYNAETYYQSNGYFSVYDFSGA